MKTENKETRLLKEILKILKSQKVEAGLPECFKESSNISRGFVWGKRYLQSNLQD